LIDFRPIYTHLILYLFYIQSACMNEMRDQMRVLTERIMASPASNRKRQRPNHDDVDVSVDNDVERLLITDGACGDEIITSNSNSSSSSSSSNRDHSGSNKSTVSTVPQKNAFEKLKLAAATQLNTLDLKSSSKSKTFFSNYFQHNLRDSQRWPRAIKSYVKNDGNVVHMLMLNRASNPDKVFLASPQPNGKQVNYSSWLKG
jgi:hypothetical protein